MELNIIQIEHKKADLSFSFSIDDIPKYLQIINKESFSEEKEGKKSQSEKEIVHFLRIDGPLMSKVCKSQNQITPSQYFTLSGLK